MASVSSHLIGLKKLRNESQRSEPIKLKKKFNFRFRRPINLDIQMSQLQLSAKLIRMHFMLKNQLLLAKEFGQFSSQRNNRDFKMRITRTSARKVTLITYIPKLTLFAVIFGILACNIQAKQTGEVQQLCVQSCVRVLKNTKIKEIVITIALTPRMSLTKGIENQFFPESPQTRCLLKINKLFLIFR